MGGKYHNQARQSTKPTALIALASIITMASAQNCISLEGSSQCPAFTNSSISTDLLGSFPFLSFVSSREDFDNQLSEYVKQDYVRSKYQNVLGCSNVTLSNTTSYYARYTTSVLCNAIVQNSIQPCGLTTEQSRPLCADSCAQQATSEEQIAVSSQLCGAAGNNFMSEIRADFTNCALPADSLSGACISAEQNEPGECGFSTNLQGLCGYCAASSPNATDSCCSASNAENRCQGVVLPTFSSMPPLIPSSTSGAPISSANATSSSTAAPAAAGSNHGLSGGAIAGIVIGSLIGLALLIGLIAFLCILRKRRANQNNNVFNTPSPKRTPQPGMGYAPPPEIPAPGGRVARMTALEAESSDEKGHPNPVLAAEARRYGDSSETDPYGGDSPTRGGIVTGRRHGSLSSSSAMNALGGDESSPSNHNEYSSPGMVTTESEQLAQFKDYYSSDYLHPGDKVATLWAYQPRAADEFELERGDMLRVVGIWDDGWATGVRIDDRAEDYDGKHKVQRDSGVSQGTGRRESPTPQGEVKAFPLVCVCLPEHWKKTIETDSSTETTSPSNQGHPQSFGNF